MKKNKNFYLLWEVVPLLIFFGLWEVTSRINLFPEKIFFPPFSQVVREFWYLSISGVLGPNLLSSLIRVLIGFFLGSFSGLLIGIIMGWNEKIDKALSPVISLLYPIPALGWLPLLMLWFGIGEILPILIIFICSFFPILYNTLTGIKNVNKNYIYAAKILGSSDIRIIYTIVLPLALPYIFTGLKLEAGMAWRVILAAEMVAIPTGIGALMMKAESLLRIDIIIVCLIILGVVCLSFEKIFILLENKFTAKWR